MNNQNAKEDWADLSPAQQQGLLDAIASVEAGRVTENEEVMKIMEEKYLSHRRMK